MNVLSTLQLAMGLIKEPLEVDIYVDPRPITKEDEKAFSDYIKADKLKRAKKTKTKSLGNKTQLHTARQAT
jgi:hypothetical protein